MLISCSWYRYNEKEGYTLWVRNRSDIKIEYIALVSNDIMNEQTIDFTEYKGGTEKIQGTLIGEELNFSSAIVQGYEVFPSQEIYINCKGKYFGENIALMIIREDGRVDIFPAFYSTTEKAIHLARVTMNEDNRSFDRLFYNSTWGSLLCPWWLEMIFCDEVTVEYK